MKKPLSFAKHHWFFLSVLILFLISAVLRFYNYENRFGLGGDQAHFVLLSRYAITSFKLPLLGPFSSAGPFQTGGEWYWFVMLGSIWNLHSILTPWIFLTITYVFFVLGMVYLGKELLGEKFGLLLGILSAISGSEIFQSVSLSNQSPINILAVGAIYCMVKYVRTKKDRYLFFLSLCVGLALSIHLQGAALGVLIVATLIFGKRPTIKGVVLSAFGVLIPWLPVFYVDLHHNFFNTKNMFYYFFLEKNKVPFEVLGRRWTTFVSIFIPDAWSRIIGGYMFNGYIGMVIVVCISAYMIFKKQITREWLIITVSLPFLFAVLRYTRTPLFESYYVFLHPFIILLVGWSIFIITKYNKYAGVLLFLLLVIPTFQKDLYLVSYQTSNENPKRAAIQRDYLIQKYPNKKFAIYDFGFKTSAYSQSLALYLDTKGKIDDRGLKIGYIEESRIAKTQHPLLEKNIDNQRLVDLQDATDKQLKEEEWIFVNPSAIYKSVQDWFTWK